MHMMLVWNPHFENHWRKVLHISKHSHRCDLILISTMEHMIQSSKAQVC